LLRWSKRDDPAIYCAFDLIEFDGRDLRDEPIETRKAELAGLLSLPAARMALRQVLVYALGELAEAPHGRVRCCGSGSGGVLNGAAPSGSQAHREPGFTAQDAIDIGGEAYPAAPTGVQGVGLTKRTEITAADCSSA
jgi:hypothetical protein